MTWRFSSAILLSSSLLFLVQPLCARMLLPCLGGTPAVWNTCMVFFQTGLLLGYTYAHYAPRWLGLWPHALVHLFALAGCCVLLPIGFPVDIPETWHPILWLLAVLSLRVGLPFVLLAASAPLLQRWFVAKTMAHPRDPYFLYAASNLGSFLALAIFPFLLEPYLSLSAISDVWRYGFVFLAVLIACCIPWGVRTVTDLASANMPPPPNRRQRARWIILAMIPSSLLLSVTTYATTDIAAIPLLWLIPLGIYLLTFTLAFASKPLIPQTLLARWLPFVVLVLAILMLSEAADPLLVVLGLHLFGLFWLAMLCHSELARTRPAPAYLTEFFLCLAFGGVLGGIFSALIAPLVFTGLVEYPLMIVLACFFGTEKASQPTQTDLLWAGRIGLLTVALVLGIQSGWFVTLQPGPPSVAVMFIVPLVLCYMVQTRPARFALCIGAVFLASWFYDGVHGHAAHRERSYFGNHRVTLVNGMVRLIHGNTVHGQQNPADPLTPLTYYSKAGPIGDVFRAFHGDPRLQQVGIIGLGTGSLAAYSEPGQDFTFFEIDPTVKKIAENPEYFTYLRDARKRATIRIELGDARLQLQRSKQEFGLLIVDAFGSDAIPLHLLTTEALQVYLRHLQSNGILAFHISNRYVDLEPVLAMLARTETQPLACYVREDHAPDIEGTKEGIYRSVWVVLARNADDLQPLLQTGSWRPARTRPGVRAWTDDSANLLKVFHWRKSD